MPRMAGGNKKTTLSPIEQYELNQWLEQNEIHSNNLRRSFTDVLPLARLLSRHYPELIDLNYYPPKNSVHNKLCNWESFNKRVLTRLGVQLSREQMVRVARSVPGSVDLLLYSIMRVQLSNERKRREREASTSSSSEDEDAHPNAAPTNVATVPTELDQAEESAPASDSTHRSATAPSMERTGPSIRQAKQAAGRMMRVRTGSPAMGAEMNSAAAAGGFGSGGGAGGGVSDVKRGELLHDTTQLSVPKIQQLLQLHEHQNYNNPHELLQFSPSLQTHLHRKSKRTVLYSHYMQAVKQLQEKNDRIARIDQWSAHLENMLHLKCDRIDDLQKQVAQAKKRLKLAQESKKEQEAKAAAMKQKEQEEREMEEKEREKEQLRTKEKEKQLQELKEKEKEMREKKEQEKEHKVATLLEKMLQTMKISETKMTKGKTSTPEEKTKTTKAKMATNETKTPTTVSKTKTMPKTTTTTTTKTATKTMPKTMPKLTPKATLKTVPKLTPKTIPKTTSKTTSKTTQKTIPKSTTTTTTKMMTYSQLQPVKNLAKMFNAYRRQYLKQRRVRFRHNTQAKTPITRISAHAAGGDGCGVAIPRKLYEFL